MAVTSANHLVIVFESVSVKCSQKLSDNKLFIKFCETWRVVLAEFISTLLLVLLGCLSCVPIQGLAYQPPLYAPLGFGFVVLFNIQAFAHISGAHMNPSVTLAAVLWGKISIGLGIAYAIAQCAGSIIGYRVLMALSPVNLITGGICTTQHISELTVYQALAVEVVLTAALNFLNCAIWDPKNKSLESVALKFGFTVAGLSIAGGPLTGASMNPARSLGPAVWTGVWAAHWIYWVGPLLGGSLSALFYKYVWLNNKSDDL
ncbi:PREDICTED: aquaporin-4-like [Papilio polytes]|uniref:aquaporin-4-like n=1 Tax=Papilio polytes TaxID=76194 RepID=UPI000675E5E3|nr:PREDICTED: aquaporin-4-like [Papilio polytes]